MVLGASHRAAPTRQLRSAVGERVIWHDLECGGYRADLPLWRELADRCSGPILEVGAGTGRVSLELARAGHDVTALDLDDQLLSALSQRRGDCPVQTVCADARSFALGGREFALCIVPMQTIQLFGGAVNRIAFLRRARAHLRRDGLLACALLTAPEPFDCAAGDAAPSADIASRGGLRYISRATRVHLRERTVLLERERLIVPDRGDATPVAWADPGSLPGGAGHITPRREVIDLDLVSASELEREGSEVGLRVCPAGEVAPTSEYVGSSVVMLRA